MQLRSSRIIFLEAFPAVHDYKTSTVGSLVRLRKLPTCAACDFSKYLKLVNVCFFF